jgi:hypothetical protein
MSKIREDLRNEHKTLTRLKNAGVKARWTDDTILED